jgi:hypothetical protein
LDLGRTLAGIARGIQEPTLIASQTIEGIPSQGIAGSVSGQQLAPLIPSATPDTKVPLEVWVGSDHLIRRVRISGQVVSADQPGVVRVLSLGGFDQPVTITPPQ